MSAIVNQPQPINENFLSPLNGRFWIRKCPTVNFYVQKTAIPGLALPAVDSPNPFVKIPQTGEHINYNELPITFKIDDDIANYLEIHNWIKALGFPDNFGEYAALASVPNYTGQGLKSEAVLVVYDQKKNAGFVIEFWDAFPISISDLEFDTTANDINYMTAMAQFAYTKFDVTSVKAGDAANYTPPWVYPLPTGTARSTRLQRLNQIPPSPIVG